MKPTIDEFIKCLVGSNAKHLIKIDNEDEMKGWMTSLMYGLMGFLNSEKQTTYRAEASTLYSNADADFNDIPLCKNEPLVVVENDGYVMLVDEIKTPKRFVATLVCRIDNEGIFVPYTSTPCTCNASNFKYRKATDMEIKCFVSSWIKKLHEPISTDEKYWTAEAYADILHILIVNGFIPENSPYELCISMNVSGPDICDAYELKYKNN